MDHIIAARLDGMLMAVRAELNGVAHFMKEDLSEEEYAEFIVSIGRRSCIDDTSLACPHFVGVLDIRGDIAGD